MAYLAYYPFTTGASSNEGKPNGSDPLRRIFRRLKIRVSLVQFRDWAPNLSRETPANFRVCRPHAVRAAITRAGRIIALAARVHRRECQARSRSVSRSLARVG